MLRVAVTGGIACGKSVAASMFSAAGIPVCEADEIVHALLEDNEAVCGKVAGRFGRKMLKRSGGVDRRRLGGAVFRDRRKLAELEAILHPMVKKAWRRWLSEMETKGRPAAAVVVPLLYEIADERSWDCVVCVASSGEVQRRRLLARGLKADEIADRLACQMGMESKMSRADHVLYNVGTLALLRKQAGRAIEAILERRYAGTRQT